MPIVPIPAWRRALFCCAVISCTLIVPRDGFSDAVWTGTGANANWSTTANWSTNALPGSPTFGTATFTSAVGNNGSTITLGNNGIAILTFSAGAAAYTFSSGTLSLGSNNNGINISNANANNETFSASSVIVAGNPAGGNSTIFINNSNTAGQGQILINGTLTGVAAQTGTTTMELEGTGGGQINGTVTNGSSSGQVIALGVTAGTWVISGSNNYTGTTGVGAGILQLTNFNAVAGSSLALGNSLFGTASGTLQLRSNTGGTFNTSNTGTTAITDNFTIDVGNNGSGTNNTLNLGATGNFSITNVTLTVTSANGYTLALGSGTLAGSGTLNPTSGSVTATSIALGGNTLTLTGAGGVNAVTGNIVGTGGVTITGTGSVWTISGTSTYTGNTILSTAPTSTGTLAFGSSSVNSGTGPIGSGTLLFGAGGAIMAVNGPQTIANPLKTNGQDGSVTIGGTQALTLTGAFNYGQTGTFVLNNTALFTMSGSWFGGSTAPFTFRGTGNAALTGNITPNISIVNLGSGTLTLGGSNTYTNGTRLFFGTTVLDASTNANASMAGGAIQVSTGTAITGTTGNATMLVKGNYTIGNSGAPTLTIKGGDGTTTGQGTLSLADGTVNTLSIKSTNTGGQNLTLGGNAGQPTKLFFEVGNTASDTIAETGVLVMNAGGVVITITQLPSTNIASGLYPLITYSSVTGPGTFSLANTTLPNATLQLVSTGTAELLKVLAFNTSQLSISPTPIFLGDAIVGQAAGSGSAVLTNTGTVGAGSSDYSTSSTGAVSVTPAASTGNGGSGATLAVGGTQALTVTGAGSVGSVSGTGVVLGTISATNVNNPTNGNAAPVNVVVNVYDPALITPGNGGMTLTNSGTGSNGANSLIAYAKVQTNVISPDAGSTQNFGAWSASVPSSPFAPGSSVNIASFNGTGLLNGTYQSSGTLRVASVTSSGSAIAGGSATYNNTQYKLTGTVAGNKSSARTDLYEADIFSSYAGYGIGSSVPGSAHTTTGTAGGTSYASIEFGQQPSNNTQLFMSFDSSPRSGPDLTRGSDILTLSGIAQIGNGGDGTEFTDVYVLQMSYDSTNSSAAFIAQNTGNGWVNAVNLNQNGAGSAFNESFSDYLLNNGVLQGDYGYYNGEAWAVLDHLATGTDYGNGITSGEFAVAVSIPEPDPGMMLCVGGIVLFAYHRFRRRFHTPISRL